MPDPTPQTLRGLSVLRPVQPSAALAAWYQASLNRMVTAMHQSVRHWVSARYRARESDIVMDASPPKEAEKEIGFLERYWNAKFAAFAVTVSRLFAKRANADVTRQLKSSTKSAIQAAANLSNTAKGAAVSSGLAPLVKALNPVKAKPADGAAGISATKTLFGTRKTGLRGLVAGSARRSTPSGMSRNANSVYQSIIAENVALIKKIPRDYHADVEGIVMRGIQNGHDLAYVSEQLGKRYDITARRARMIARDQTNKSTESLAAVRLMDAGITEAVWLHRAGPKEPRPSHVTMSGTRFKLAEGCFDAHEGRKVKPGELVNCGCTCYPVVPEKS